MEKTSDIDHASISFSSPDQLSLKSRMEYQSFFAPIRAVGQIGNQASAF